MNSTGHTDEQKKRELERQYEHEEGTGNPISLWGASFTEVLDALLKTKPMPKIATAKEENKASK